MGLAAARDPSALFLAGSEAEASGRAVFAAMEGSRPVLAEVQALAGPESAGSSAPLRSSAGTARALPCCSPCSMRAAACASACATSISASPAAIASPSRPAISPLQPRSPHRCSTSRSLPVLCFSAKSRSPERFAPVGRIEPRLREAARLGFTQAWAPVGAPEAVDGMAVHAVSRLQDLVDVLGRD